MSDDAMDDANPLSLDSVRACRLCATLGEDQVPAEGNPDADVMFVGRDPGATEAELGRPFVGPCGDILNYILDEAQLDREDIYITNAVKCHTPNNRGPHPAEIRMCGEHWLRREIEGVNPAIVVVMGKDAHDAVVRGHHKFQHLHVATGKKRVLISIYHPGYILRTGTLDTYIPAVGQLVRKCLDAYMDMKDE